MRLVQFADAQSRHHLGIVDDDVVVDLSQGEAPVCSVYELYYARGGDREGLATVARRILETLDAPRRIPLDELLNPPAGQASRLRKPVSGPAENPHALRVWLAGVTHEVSARLREIEAHQATGAAVNVYDQKYRECAAGGRPELFPKIDPAAVVASGQAVTRPADTLRLVPETELVSVYALRHNGQVERLGYTGGNDVTDNGIESANPLNLPQAKNWAAGCASLGPVLVTADEFDDGVVPVSCEILRQGQRVARKEGETGQQRLNMPDRLRHLERLLFQRLPLGPGQLQVLYWGTPIVFTEDDFPSGLQAGDIMKLSFPGGIGVLENSVVSLTTPDQLCELD